MASIKVSELPTIQAITANDVLIVNDEDIATSSITFANFTGSLTGQDLIFSGILSFIAPVTFGGASSPTFNADVIFNQNVAIDAGATLIGFGEKILLGQLSNVGLPLTVPDGSVLTYDGNTSSWGAATSGSMNNLVDDTTPELGGNLQVNGYEIKGSASAAGTNGKNIVLSPDTDGLVIIKGYEAGQIDGSITLNCYNNTHGVQIKSPPHDTATTYTLILPNNMGSNGQVLTTNGTSVTTWSTIDYNTVGAASAAQGIKADSAIQRDADNQIQEYADDAAAAAAGLPVGGLYRIGNAVQVRLA